MLNPSTIAVAGLSSRATTDSETVDAGLFDADFFGLSALQAQMLAPQQRLLLECAWEALESAGYRPDWPGKIGIFASVDEDQNYFHRLLAYPHLLRPFSESEIRLLTAPDLAPAWVSQKLNWNGPCLRIAAGECSSLVALHMACLALGQGDCDIALAGGVGVLTRPKDPAESASQRRDWAAGLVVLRRFTDALAAGDSIQANIRTSRFIRNGGVHPGNTSFLALRQTLEEFLMCAGIDPASGEPLDLVLAHPVYGEAAIERLKGEPGLETRGNPDFNADCARDLGAVGGIAALIHAIRRMGLHKRTAIVDIGLAGACAQVLLDPAAAPSTTSSARPWQFLCLSARTQQALEAQVSALKDYLSRHPYSELADVAYTLQIGRKSWEYRQAVLCQSVPSALERLSAEEPIWGYSGVSGAAKKDVVFLFPGAGTQYVRMACGLYESEPAFRNAFDECCGLLSSTEAAAIKTVLSPDDPNAGLDHPIHSTAALFVVEYSLARLWMRWGVAPEAMIGHSIGEYTAACISGVFRLEDALKIVAFRSRLFETLPPGAMLSVTLGESDVASYLSDEVSLAAVNAPSHCVLSGSGERIKQVYRELSARKVEARLLRVGRAGHSVFVAPVAGRFAEFVAQFPLSRPRIPYISNYSGTWVEESQATDPQYWALHLRHTVRFSQGLEELLLVPNRVFLEVGPSTTLCALARQHPHAEGRVILASMRDVRDSQADTEVLMQTAARLWANGVDLDCAVFHAGESRRRVPLPTYAFQRRECWVETQPPAGTSETLSAQLSTPDSEPRNEIEASIARIWQAVLGVRQLPARQSFAACGGTESLLRQLHARLRQEFGIGCERFGLTCTIPDLCDWVAAEAIGTLSTEELSQTLDALDLFPDVS